MEYVIVGGLIVIALGVAVYLFGKQIQDGCRLLYGGSELNVAAPARNDIPASRDSLYAGPPRRELWIES